MLPKYLERLIFVGCALLVVGCLIYGTQVPHPYQLDPPLATLLLPPYPQTTAVLTHTTTLTMDTLIFRTPDDGLTVARWYTDTLVMRGWDPAPWVAADPPPTADEPEQRHGFVRYIGCSRYTLLLRYTPTTRQVIQLVSGSKKVGKSCY